MAVRARSDAFGRNHRTNVIRRRFYFWRWRPDRHQDLCGREYLYKLFSVYHEYRYILKKGGLRRISWDSARYFELDGICFIMESFELGERGLVHRCYQKSCRDFTYSGIIGPIVVMLRSACDAVRSVGRFERFIRDCHFRQLCGLNSFQGEFEMVSVGFSITFVYKKENQVKKKYKKRE